MSTYIALLRGINVSGQKKIPMTDLRALFEDLKFTDVKTYIQSGNVVFGTRRTAQQKLKQAIETRIEENYGYHADCFVLDGAQLAAVIDQNPIDFSDPKRFFVTFLGACPETLPVTVLNAAKADDEIFKVVDQQIYLHCPSGYGRTKLNNNFFEKKLGVSATTRNWKTVMALSELVG